MMLRFSCREIQYRLAFRIFGPNFVDRGFRFTEGRICLAPEREERFFLLFCSPFRRSIERFGYEIGERLQRLITIRKTKSKSAKKVIGTPVGIGPAVLKSQRDLEASSF